MQQVNGEREREIEADLVQYITNKYTVLLGLFFIYLAVLQRVQFDYLWACNCPQIPINSDDNLHKFSQGFANVFSILGLLFFPSIH